MNSFKDQRQAKLRELLQEPHIQDDELVQELSEYLESEIASAYGRGLRHGQGADKPSALHAGKLRPSGRFAERAQ